MSEKLIEKIKEAINTEKEKFLNNIVEHFSNKNLSVEVLEKVFDCFYYQSKKDGDINILLAAQNFFEKQYKFVDNKILSLVYKDLINGLYAGKDKDNINQRIERLYRNKYKVIEYIQLNVR